jgi:hypothetical protein
MYFGNGCDKRVDLIFFVIVPSSMFSTSRLRLWDSKESVFLSTVMSGGEVAGASSERVSTTDLYVFDREGWLTYSQLLWRFALLSVEPLFLVLCGLVLRSLFELGAEGLRGKRWFASGEEERSWKR